MGTDPSTTGQAAMRDPSTSSRAGIPEVPPLHVCRPRLVAALDGATATPLVLVSGPAGSGKTSLVAEWLRDGRSPRKDLVGWITFEDDDSRLWQPLMDCLTRLGMRLPRIAEQPDPDLLLGRSRLKALAAVLSASVRRWTMVLDGYELRDPELAAELSYLVDHAHGALRLVFATRVDPVLPLYRYRLDDSLVEVRGADLALTDPEAGELLRRSGADLGDVTVHDLNARLNGWAAGLRFAARALSRHEHPEESVAAVVAQDADINAYLLAEVLGVQEPETRRLLLQTCVPDVLTPELAEELAGPAADRRLAELARANMFLEPVPDQPGCHRYYPVFRDLLRAQLAWEDPDAAADLHRRAAAWLHARGMTSRSVAQLATGALWGDVAARLVDDLLIARLVLRQDERLVDIARRIPPDLADAPACAVRAALALAASDAATCAEELSRARRAMPPDDPTSSEDADPIVLAVAVIDAVRACTADDAGSAEAAVARAVRTLDAVRRPVAGLVRPELEGLVDLAGAVIALRRGELGQARAALARVEEVTDLPARVRAASIGYHALADALDGRLTHARRRALQALALAEDAHVLPENRNPAASVALALVALERDDLALTRQHLTAARASRGLVGDPVCRTITSGVLAHVEAAAGAEQPVMARLESVCALADAHDPWLAGWLRLQAAELSVAQGRADRALAALDGIVLEDGLGGAVVAAAAYAEQGEPDALERSLTLARSSVRPLPVEVTRLLVEGVQESRRHSPRHATPLVERALVLAASEELRRPFREAAPAVRHLLASNAQLLGRHGWLKTSSATRLRESTRSPSPGTTATAPVGTPATRQVPREDPTDLSNLVVEPLTAKEREVLGHLEELLTTEEIAAKMFVSVNTIRTHVRSILRKLGVNRRNSAVRRARELGLFEQQPPVG
ncbi:LuxR C-terminal-related transcriptional regulator [Nocardioides sp. MAHUQ-72]|uniref:LuxR C-terminal-related transcriptional regulator n=1 Tax=unclassified Nocardioides TaxID=2615069 RepID=UPI00361278F5